MDMKRKSNVKAAGQEAPTGLTGQIFSIIFLLVNSVGIAGALIEVLGIQWYDSHGDTGILDGKVFWAGMLFMCAAAILLRRGYDKKRHIWLIGLIFLFLAVLTVIFRNELYGGILLLLKDPVSRLNERYQFHIRWPDGAQVLEEAGRGGYNVWIATLSALALCLPMELLVGFFWKRGAGFFLAVGNGIWFIAACAWDVFPGFFFLVFCVLGLLAAIVEKDFVNRPDVGFGAAAWVMVLSGIAMGTVYWFLLPVLDEQYEEMLENRQWFYQVVNEEWLPGLQDTFSGYGIGAGVDVSGDFYRDGVFSYTVHDTYRVTLDKAPKKTLYLKGYVGGIYGADSWEIQSDAFFEDYYKENGLSLPENYRELANISYKAFSKMYQNKTEGYIQIEELGGKGSYSIYPYGALLTAEYHVYSDGSVARKDKEYGFEYCIPVDNTNAIRPEWYVEAAEQQYRKYVYDTFLDYPAEDLPLLTENLDKENIRLDNVYLCAADIMEFLDRQADYNLDAGSNPLDTDFVEYFLFESHEGYCVHFASAAVLAFRYFGIPARYVTGYSVAPSAFEKDNEGNYTAVLTGRQAHAWAEIYLDKIGWIPVEMTPGAVAFPRDNQEEMLAQLEQLTGQDAVLIEDIRVSDIIKPEKKDISETGETDQGLPGEVAESNKPNSTAKPAETQKPAESKNPGESKNTTENKNPAVPVSADGQTELAATEEEVQSRQDYGILYTILAIGLVLAGAAAALYYMRDMRIRRWYGALAEDGTNKKISMLYRNVRKALHIAGCSKRLNAVSEIFWQSLQKICPQMGRKEYEVFCTIMEKNTFGNVESSPEEFLTVCLFHDRLMESLYEKSPLYKRLCVKIICHPRTGKTA